jgi:DNA-cytosine methyltransferase
LENKLKVLDLFSGIGGFSLGLHSTGIFDTIKFVEFDEFCQKVLKKNYPNIPIEGDIKNVKGKEFEADIVVGGFPCQPFSVAGKQKGRDDNRYLWPEMFRLIKEIKPEFVIGENVQGLVNLQNGMVLRQVQDDLEGEGFEVQCFLIPASGIGAWHQRFRVWIVGHSKHNGLLAAEKLSRDKKINGGTQEGQNQTIESKRTSGSRNDEDVSNTDITRSFKEHSATINRENEGNGSIDESSSRRNTETKEDVPNTERKRLEGLSEQGTTLSRENERSQSGSTNSSRSSEDVSNTESIGTGGCRDINQEEGREGSISTQSDGTHANVSYTISELSDGCSSTTRDSEAELIRLECNEGWHWNQVRSEVERCSEQDLQHRQESNTNTHGSRLKERDVPNQSEGEINSSGQHAKERNTKTWWQIESDLCGVPNGISRELDKDRASRIKSLGNAIVPQMARIFGLAIKKVLSDS